MDSHSSQLALSDPAALSKAKQAPACHFVIFGAGGDPHPAPADARVV